MPTFPLYTDNNPTRPYTDILLAGQGEGLSLEEVSWVTDDEGQPVPAGEYLLREPDSLTVLPVTVGADGRVVTRNRRLSLPS